MRLYIFFILILISSCTKVKDKPADLIAKREMVDILVDYYLYQNHSSINESPQVLGNMAEINVAILKKHQISFSQFENSMAYYALQDRDKYGKILEDVQAKLTNLNPSLIEDTLKNKVNKPKIKSEKKSIHNLDIQKKASKKKVDSVRINFGEKKRLKTILKDSAKLNVDSLKNTQKLRR